MSTLRLKFKRKHAVAFIVLIQCFFTLGALSQEKSVREASKNATERSVLDSDQEFVAGSGITLSALTRTQAEHVAVLGAVWGFLKYHHPRVASGQLHWDFELFRVLPPVLDSEDSETLNRRLVQWVDELGVPDGCDPCATAAKDTHLVPRLNWIRDAGLLGHELSGQLQRIHTNRFSGEEQFYVTQPHNRNAVFDGELSYSGMKPPDAGYRILALLRYWNIVEYWFPYRDLIDDDWQSILREFLPRFVESTGWDDYRLELIQLIARISDTHANLTTVLEVRPPRGHCYWPVEIRFIEGRATITGFTYKNRGPASAFEIGDVIEEVDGRSVSSLIAEWAPFYTASNQPARLLKMARYLRRGECGESQVIIDRRGLSRTLTVDRLAGVDRKPRPRDRPGETFQLLSPEVAYLKLSSIVVKDVDSYIARASGTRGMVIDIRNYPSEFVVFALGSRLIQEPTPFARFTFADMKNPGAFVWGAPVVLNVKRPSYEGKVVILVDETSVSSSEYTAMALRAGPHAVVVGSTTAGADGNISRIQLPGGLTTRFSGIGVFYPDKTATQRVGILPDITVRPTISGMLDGRDEMLEGAVRHILGPDADAELVRKMASQS